MKRKCFACQIPMDLVWDDPDLNFNCPNQLDNALEIDFDGGYGMFIDPMGDDYKVIICHDCAHDLCDKVPWIANLLLPYLSHSHTKEFAIKNPIHRGWDMSWLDHTKPPPEICGVCGFKNLGHELTCGDGSLKRRK